MDLTGNQIGTFTYTDHAGVAILVNSNFVGTSAYINNWGVPERIDVQEVGDTIEMTFLETSNLFLAVYPQRPPERRVFKIIYSCVDSKWNKSERIYGEIVPAQREIYKF
jgi:hypothetical protein